MSDEHLFGPEEPSTKTYRRGCRCDECRRANTEYSRLRRGSKEFKPADHGTRSKYTSGCRCPKCCEANREYQRRYMAENRWKWSKPVVKVPQHGKVSTYRRHKCRCEDCTEANRIASRAYRERKRKK